MTTNRTDATGIGTLPPGQRWVAGFPRFGTHLNRPAPPLPPEPDVEICGAVAEPFAVALPELNDLPRRTLNADFHCVAGWSAANIHWEGVAFADFYREIIAPTIPPGGTITHLVFRGLDGFASVVRLDDVLGDEVLLADHLEGRPLDAAHGAPLRLVSPAQYGYVSTKHLCSIEAFADRPPPVEHANVIDRIAERVTESHPRARVWEEERHGSLPGWLVRPFYRMLKAPLLWICTRNQIDADVNGDARRRRRADPNDNHVEEA